MVATPTSPKRTGLPVSRLKAAERTVRARSDQNRRPNDSPAGAVVPALARLAREMPPSGLGLVPVGRVRRWAEERVVALDAGSRLRLCCVGSCRDC